MRYITEGELRDQFAGGLPAHYELPAGCMLTPSARQYLMDLKLYQQGSGRQNPQANSGASKPEHMTHLNRREMVSKAHPSIALRGKLDTLEAEILILMITGPQSFRAPLNDALQLTRQVLAADVKDCALSDWTLDGMTAQQVHSHSHHPERFGLPGHILPAFEQGLFPAQLNRLRALARETELAAITAYRQSDRIRHEDSLLALNRLSSYFYVLQLRAVQQNQREP